MGGGDGPGGAGELAGALPAPPVAPSPMLQQGATLGGGAAPLPLPLPPAFVPPPTGGIAPTACAAGDTICLGG